MRLSLKLTLFITLVLVMVLALPATAMAQGNAKILPDQFVFGDNYTLHSGDTLDGNLWIFGGNVTLEDGSRITGDVRLAGGTLQADGEIDGNISSTGGSINLGKTALVHGDVNMLGGSINRENAAQILGELRNEPQGPFQFTAPGVRVPAFEIQLNPFWGLLTAIFRAFALAALAILVVMFWPRQSERTARAIVAQPLTAGVLGLLTVAVVPVVLLVLIITIIGIPVSLVGIIILAIMVIFGWISLGTEIGHRLADAFRTEWALPVAAGLGTLILTLVTFAIGEIPCIGWIAPVAVGMVGLGGVLLTRFGTQTYPTLGQPTGSNPLSPAPFTPAPGYPPAAPVYPPESDAPPAPEGGADVFPAPEDQSSSTPPDFPPAA